MCLIRVVIEWDTSLHVQGTKLWTKAVLADGGQHCKDLCDIIGEPLIEGMLVGTARDKLDLEQREQVGCLLYTPDSATTDPKRRHTYSETRA